MLTTLRWSLLCLFALLTTVNAAEPRVALVYNGGQEVFQQFAETLTPLLRAQGQNLERHDSRNWSNGEPPAGLNEYNLIIAAGSEATALLAKKPPRAAVLSVLLSRQQFEQHLAVRQHRDRAAALHAISAIYQDPPFHRQLLLAQLLLPGLSNIGYLYQPGESEQLSVLTLTTQKLGLKLVAQPVAADAELPAALVSVIGQSNVLLISANSGIYNRYTIKTILTAAYRQEKVTIGSSPAFVKAGSLATTFSSVQHIAQQVSELFADASKDVQASAAMPLPAASYARYFEISINTDVARSLNIRLPDSDSLLQQLQERDRAAAKAGVDHE